MPTFPNALRECTDVSAEPGGSTCYACETALMADERVYRESYGSVAHPTEHGVVFDTTGGIIVRHFCVNCWQERRGRENAAHMEDVPTERLWAMLEAADGALVADSLHITVGGRGWARVVDGRAQARHATVEAMDDEHYPAGVRHTTARTEGFTEANFHDLFTPTKTHTPTVVLLRPVEDTPFADPEVAADAE